MSGDQMTSRSSRSVSTVVLAVIAGVGVLAIGTAAVLIAVPGLRGWLPGAGGPRMAAAPTTPPADSVAGSPTASPSASTTTKAGASAASTLTDLGTCRRKSFDQHVGQALFAVRVRIAEPVKANKLAAVATSDLGSAQAAAAAASYVQRMLVKGRQDLGGCPTSTALRAVLKQTASLYGKDGKVWAAGSADAPQVNAALAMLANVNVQAARAGFALHEHPVPAADLR